MRLMDDRRCDTCQKKSKYGRECKVLKKMIGKDGDCWAWTDDPDWERKFQEASKAYQKMGGGIIDDDDD